MYFTSTFLRWVLVYIKIDKENWWQLARSMNILPLNHWLLGGGQVELLQWWLSGCSGGGMLVAAWYMW